VKTNNFFELISPEASFLQEVQARVAASNGEYLDCILYVAEKRNIEIEQLVPLIKNNPVIKSAIQKEAEQLNFLKKKKKRRR